jgi:hypothetical protein
MRPCLVQARESDVSAESFVANHLHTAFRMPFFVACEAVCHVNLAAVVQRQPPPGLENTAMWYVFTCINSAIERRYSGANASSIAELLRYKRACKGVKFML